MPRSMCNSAPTHSDQSVDRTARRSGLRSVVVGALAVSLRTLRPAGHPIRVREAITALHGMPEDAPELAVVGRGLTAILGVFPVARCVLGLSVYPTKNWPFVSSGPERRNARPIDWRGLSAAQAGGSASGGWLRCCTPDCSVAQLWIRCDGRADGRLCRHARDPRSRRWWRRNRETGAG